MNKNIIKEIVSQVSIIPGFIGFANSNVDKKPLLLNNFASGIDMMEIDNKYIVKIFVIILQSISSKKIVKEIEKKINKIFRENNLKLEKTTIYIRGVK